MTPEQWAEAALDRWSGTLPDFVATVSETIARAVAAERAKWVAACRAADEGGYQHQARTVLDEMGATDEVIL